MPDILVVDDEAMIRESLQTLLTREGFSVDVAVDGNDAMEKIAADPPRVLVTDILMPEREGIETICALRRTNPEIRIVAISGGGRRGHAQFLDLARRLGADAALAKPFSRAKIVETVRGLMAG